MGHLCSSALIIYKLRLWTLLSTATLISIKRWKRDLCFEKALRCLNYITFGTWRNLTSWLDVDDFSQWQLWKKLLWAPAIHCHIALLFIFSIATYISTCINEVQIELIWQCESYSRASKAPDFRCGDNHKAFGASLSHRRPFMPLSSSVFPHFQTNDTQKLTSTPT